MKSISVKILSIGGMLFMLSCGTSKKLETANAQIQALSSQVETLNKQAGENQKLISELKEENISFNKDAQECRIVKENLSNNLKAMNNALAEQGTSIRKIYAKIDTALAKFNNAGIDVYYKNGLVHIAMKDQLIFKSGSTAVGWEGKQALAVIADVLKDFPGVSIYVIGNTDNVPVKSGFKDNWSLSTERANAIVRVMRDENNIDPSRMISGGRAMYHPIANNETAEGKSKNRRTDIVLNPNLERLWEMAGINN
jgi:chemotaxis protein MotB